MVVVLASLLVHHSPPVVVHDVVVRPIPAVANAVVVLHVLADVAWRVERRYFVVLSNTLPDHTASVTWFVVHTLFVVGVGIRSGLPGRVQWDWYICSHCDC